ncbi:MAG: hypothetical protein ABFC84_18685 [Veillonellales bacterium]
MLLFPTGCRLFCPEFVREFWYAAALGNSRGDHCYNKAEGSRETAKRLLDMGMSVSDITKATGLSETEVHQMQCH